MDCNYVCVIKFVTLTCDAKRQNAKLTFELDSDR